MRKASSGATAPANPATSTQPASSGGAGAPTEPTSNAPAGQGPASVAPNGAAAATGSGRGEGGAPSAISELLKGLEDGSLDRDELLKHPKLAAKVGEMVSRGRLEERAELDRLRAQEQERALEAQRRRLRDSDPEAFAEFDRQLEQQRQAEAAQSGQQVEALKGANEAVAEWVGSLPDSLREAVASAVPEGKTYDGDWQAGFKSYLADVGKALNAWHKQELTAMRKQLLAELNGEAPVHDLGGGTAPRSLTKEQIKKMTPAEINSRWGEVSAALSA